MTALEKTSSASKNFCRVLDIRVTKCVWMNVREVMFLTEFAQPIGDAVWMQPTSVILCEDVAAVYPPVSLGKLHAKLFRFPFAEQFKTLGRKANGPHTAGLGFAFIHTF